MRERPIIFSSDMVRAILAGRKTQTRRVLRADDAYNGATWVPDAGRWHPCRDELSRGALDPIGPGVVCPYGQPGERLWVRETFCPSYFDDWSPAYRADYDARRIGDVVPEPKWRPSIFMPRALSRITLEVTGVRIERLQEITEEDEHAEGVLSPAEIAVVTLDAPELTWGRDRFRDLWDRINVHRAQWSSNPWVWRVEFRRASPPH